MPLGCIGGALGDRKSRQVDEGTARKKQSTLAQLPESLSAPRHQSTIAEPHSTVQHMVTQSRQDELLQAIRIQINMLNLKIAEKDDNHSSSSTMFPDSRKPNQII
ncbi:hypothetical protein BLNAU_16848 [Blattamonas nauphoetae]|uniref:Uncharacterized protein n=1 Tax=Blattamonas nauphoetae TaxID=2049346 RepID=A0ABQ9X967_9EUKA|nr:hypothetical protein BLNAU_16848 [Blattamonas nauphoetae]